MKYIKTFFVLSKMNEIACSSISSKILPWNFKKIELKLTVNQLSKGLKYIVIIYEAADSQVISKRSVWAAGPEIFLDNFLLNHQFGGLTSEYHIWWSYQIWEMKSPPRRHRT